MYFVYTEGNNPFTDEFFSTERSYYDYFDACNVAEIEARNGLYKNNGTTRVTVCSYNEDIQGMQYIRHYAIKDCKVILRDGVQEDKVVYEV